MSTILKDHLGCDFCVQLPADRAATPVKILQITDPQIIDASQRRPDCRFTPDTVAAYAPENFDIQCGNHIRSLITQTKPDMIFITGDIVYGRYDDNGTALAWLVRLMDSFGIPWAPVFGNHDNESAIGVTYQCSLFENAAHCMFKRGNVTGNGNYTVGVAVGDQLIRAIHMLDSNGCSHSDDPSVMPQVGIFPDQFALVERNTQAIREATGRTVPAFLAFHIPHAIFAEAERAKGYVTIDRFYYVIGVDVEARDGDFGFKLDGVNDFSTEVDMVPFARANGIEGIFIGHHHNTSICLHYQGLTLVYGLKIGQYDSYIPGNLGGTLIQLLGDTFTVNNISSCCPYGPVPPSAQRYKNFFVG